MIQFRGLNALLREAAENSVKWARAYGVEPRITSVLRGWSEQKELYDNYQQCLARGRYPWYPGCRYPANPPGWSGHQYGLAWDSTVPAGHGTWWRQVREAYGWRVPSNDEIHAEHPQTREYVEFVNQRR